MQNPETNEQRMEIMDEWVKRLGLEKWTIEATPNCNPSEIGDERAGESRVKHSIKHAKIKILASQFFEEPEEYDFEKTLVHELLHVKFGLLWDNLTDLAQDVLHQTIEELATALVEAKRS